MAKNQIIDLSTTAGNNTDVGGININEGMFPSGVNDAQRYVAKMLADAVTRHVLKAVGTYTAVKTDHNQFWRCTGAVTLNLTAAATLTDGWCLWVRANGGAVTIDPNGAELIDGAATVVIPDGMTVLVICTGTAFFTWGFPSVLVINSGTATFPATAAGLNLYYETDSGIASIGPVAGGSTSLVLGATNAGAYAGQVTIIPASVALRALLDLSGAAASQIKFGNANNSADTATLDGYTDWIASTPTWVGLGTVSTNQYFSKRVGDTLHIKAKVTSGTAAAVEVRLPLLLNGVSLTADVTKVPAAIEIAGTAITNTNSATFFGIYPLIESSATYLTFGIQASGANAFTKILGTGFGTGNAMSLIAQVPISGW